MSYLDNCWLGSPKSWPKELLGQGGHATAQNIAPFWCVLKLWVDFPSLAHAFWRVFLQELKNQNFLSRHSRQISHPADTYHWQLCITYFPLQIDSLNYLSHCWISRLNKPSSPVSFYVGGLDLRTLMLFNIQNVGERFILPQIIISSSFFAYGDKFMLLVVLIVTVSSKFFTLLF